jgi:DNA-directed RNA polymerase specialized sigma24 family protein
MATALDWEDRFCEFVRVSPHDGRGIWALIAECMEDDDALTRTFNAILKARHVPRDDREDWRQELAEHLAEDIERHPDLNLDHRRRGIPAAAWFYCVIDHLCHDMLRAKHPKSAAQVSLDAVLAPGGSLTDDIAEVSDELFEAARVAQEERERLVDAGLDLDGALTACDASTAALIATVANDGSVEAVARVWHLSYATAWRKVKKARDKVRQLLGDYGADEGGKV